MREAWRGERRIRLSPKEFDLLDLFMRHPSQVLPRELITARVWGYDSETGSNVLEVYIRRLRKKLGEPDLIGTAHGVGYALRESGS